MISKKFQEVNFENIIKSINKYISECQWRNLTLPGEIQLVKTSQFLNFVIFNFMWRGRDKVKRLSLVSDYRALD